jgi:hypothetical protein
MLAPTQAQRPSTSRAVRVLHCSILQRAVICAPPIHSSIFGAMETVAMPDWLIEAVP